MKITKNQLRRIIKEEKRRQDYSHRGREQGESIDSLEPLDEGAMDWLQTTLDVVGFIPGVGEFADGVNALISLGRGNPFEALLSAISMVPGAGDIIGKGGKVILKVFEPAMDLIKAGAGFAEIAAKVGPNKIAKIKPVIEAIKGASVKYGPKLKELFSAVKSKDLDALEKIMGKKIPTIARSKVGTVLEKVADKIPEAEIDSVFKFLAKIDLGDKIFGRAEGEEGEAEGEEGEAEGEEEEEVEVAVDQALAASKYVHGQLLGEAIFGKRYINEQLIRYGTQIEFIINESVKGSADEVPEEIRRGVAKEEKRGISSEAVYDEVKGVWRVEEQY